MISDQLREIPVVNALEARDGSAVVEGVLHADQLALYIEPAKIVDVCAFLKTEQKFARLSGVTAVDWFPMEPRFEVVYLLHSIEQRGQRLRLKCRVSGDDPVIDSVTSVWKGANWYEREVFDLFGIIFRGHPDLTRIMMPDHWEGHPLRKDFPVYGLKYTYKDE
jgi:NADH-quinone oxidoreductase subunit C